MLRTLIALTFAGLFFIDGVEDDRSARAQSGGVADTSSGLGEDGAETSGGTGTRRVSSGSGSGGGSSGSGGSGGGSSGSGSGRGVSGSPAPVDPLGGTGGAASPVDPAGGAGSGDNDRPNSGGALLGGSDRPNSGGNPRGRGGGGGGPGASQIDRGNAVGGVSNPPDVRGISNPPDVGGGTNPSDVGGGTNPSDQTLRYPDDTDDGTEGRPPWTVDVVQPISVSDGAFALLLLATCLCVFSIYWWSTSILVEVKILSSVDAGKKHVVLEVALILAVAIVIAVVWIWRYKIKYELWHISIWSIFADPLGFIYLPLIVSFLLSSVTFGKFFLSMHLLRAQDSRTGPRASSIGVPVTGMVGSVVTIVGSLASIIALVMYAVDKTR